LYESMVQAGQGLPSFLLVIGDVLRCSHKCESELRRGMAPGGRL
jgi:hypothetical protein